MVRACTAVLTWKLRAMLARRSNVPERPSVPADMRALIVAQLAAALAAAWRAQRDAPGVQTSAQASTRGAGVP